MPKSGPNKRKRVPKLSFTETQGIGWHVSFRDPATGSPIRHRFGIQEKGREPEARVAYHRWLAEYLENGPPTTQPKRNQKDASPRERMSKLNPNRQVIPGSIVHVASGFLSALEARVRQPDEPRRQGTIAKAVYKDRRKHITDFLEFLNGRHGERTTSRMKITDLVMADIEGFNQWAVDQGYSSSQVNKRMQMVKGIIDRSGRPEHGGQVLCWNWDSRDVAHGRPSEARTLPTREQLRRVLAACELREQTMVWLAIGLGFGQQDLANIRVGQIDSESYDLRRSKTGVERFGTTPPLVWVHVKSYLAASSRKPSDLLFVTRRGYPIVHGRVNAVTQWWAKLRTAIGETTETLDGFYTLRHLGATEFGSRPSCSISDMRRWLGHGASSRVADLYMRPVGPEHREVVQWVRKRLASRTLKERSK